MKNGLTTVPQIAASRGAQLSESPSFMDTVGATLAYRYDPLIDFIEEQSRFGTYDLPEEGFSALENISEDLKPYSSTLLRATNQDHLNFLETQMRQSLETRQTLAESGFGAQFAAEVFDPINWVAIPLSRGLSVSRAALQSGTGTAAIVAGQEALRYPFDPLATPEETQFSVGASFVFGGMLGGLTRIPVSRRARAIQEAETEIQNFRQALDSDDASIAPSMFTDSWLYKGVTTPMKRILQDKSIPDSARITALEIANDAGVLLAMNKQGKALRPSVFQNSKLLEGEWVQAMDEMLITWGESTKKGVTNPLDYHFKRRDFEDWLEMVDTKSMKGIKAADDFEARAMATLNKYYDTWEIRLREQGMIGSSRFYADELKRKEAKIVKLQKTLDDSAGRGTKSLKNKLQGTISKLTSEVEELKVLLDDAKQEPTMPRNERVFRPRYWDRDSISANRDKFESVLFNWFKDNPAQLTRFKNGKLETIQLSTGENAIRKRVTELTDNLLGLRDDTDFDSGYFGIGKSKHMKHRTIDIPNELVLDFIEKNPIKIMKAYTARTGTRYEFSRQFGGKDIDEVLDDTMIDLLSSGMTEAKAYSVLRDMRHMYDRVSGNALRRADTWDATVAQVLRDLAQLNYLGSAGISTITEPAKMVLEHGFGPTMKGLFNIMSDNQLKLGAKEARIAGEALEIIMGSAHLRLVDDLSNNPFKDTVFDKAKNYFYLANGLAPITRIFKDFDAMMRSHTLIDYSVRLTNGNATRMEMEYLARYGIDAEVAADIAKAPWQRGKSGMYIANTGAWNNAIQFPETKATIVSGPTGRKRKDGSYVAAHYNGKDKIFIDEEFIRTEMWNSRGWKNPKMEGVNPIPDGIINSPDDLVAFVKMHEIMHTRNSSKDLGFDRRKKSDLAAYENAINDLAIAEFRAQPRVKDDTVRRFRTALSSGVANTILMGTPADKPIITDGVAYIPMRVARNFGMKEDAKYKGYARVESQLLGLPFQFYSYALAATNKIAAAHAHGQVKSQFLGLALSMGLGYMVLDYKTPDFVDLSFQDKLARSFDYSGTAALYSDLFYTAMSTSMALGGPNLTNGFLQPRFPQKPNLGEAATGVLGAGPSIGLDYGTGIYNLLTGNVGEGTKEIVRNLPFARMWFWKGKVNDITNMLEDELDGPSGFGRY
jgi:hypothetical protein